MGSEGRSYEVVIKSVETVAAVLLVQEHRLPPSNFDLLLPPIDVGVFFCFKKPTTIPHTHTHTDIAASAGPTTFPSMLVALKSALAKVNINSAVLKIECVDDTYDS
jgi:Transferase family